jgi:hypothetical protein
LSVEPTIIRQRAARRVGGVSFTNDLTDDPD